MKYLRAGRALSPAARGPRTAVAPRPAARGGPARAAGALHGLPLRAPPSISRRPRLSPLSGSRSRSSMGELRRLGPLGLAVARPR